MLATNYMDKVKYLMVLTIFKNKVVKLHIGYFVNPIDQTPINETRKGLVKHLNVN